jgi:hypothetical protein
MADSGMTRDLADTVKGLRERLRVIIERDGYLISDTKLDYLLKENIEPAIRDLIAQATAEALEKAAQLCDGYAREGRLSQEYACETADEIAARIRALAPDIASTLRARGN